MVRELIRDAMGVECALGEAGDAGEDLVGGLGPDEGLGLGVVDVDDFADRLLEPGDAAVRAAADLLLRELGEPALDAADATGSDRAPHPRLQTPRRSRAWIWDFLSTHRTRA
jgi:hypothetical protein